MEAFQHGTRLQKLRHNAKLEGSSLFELLIVAVMLCIATTIVGPTTLRNVCFDNWAGY
jgi:hypothetical protein